MERSQKFDAVAVMNPNIFADEKLEKKKEAKNNWWTAKSNESLAQAAFVATLESQKKRLAH